MGTIEKPRPIYLDYHATTPVDPRVVAKMVHVLTMVFGNPSSKGHAYGDEADRLIADARADVAALLGGRPRDLVFTSGATEAITMAIHSVVEARRGGPVRLVVSPLEHKAVLDTCRAYARRGWAEVAFLHANRLGRLDLDEIEATLLATPDLLCVMAANNEIGNLYPIETIARLANERGVPLLVDATQAAGRVPLDFDAWGIGYLALSAHKMYGPKGVGALLIRRGLPVSPLVYGGAQQRGLRAGTLNVPGIVGIGEGARLRRSEMSTDEPAIRTQRDYLQAELLKLIPGLQVNGDPEARLPGNLSLTLPGCDAESVRARLYDALAFSTSAACASGTLEPSHVLRAIGMADWEIERTLRFGLGKFTTAAEIAQAAELLGATWLAMRDHAATSL